MVTLHRRGRVGRSDWRRHLARADGRQLPPSVIARLRWYEEQVATKRIGFYSFEITVIVLAASIPVAASSAATPATVALLGSAVTALLGIGQVFRWSETWGRLSGTFAALQLEAVAWSVGAGPYADQAHADATLATTVETLIAAESAQLSPLHRRSSRRESEYTGPVPGQENASW